MLGECVVSERIAPVVAIADNHSGEMGGLSKQMMRQDVPCLPAAFAFAKTQVPMDQMQWAVGRGDHRELSAARFTLAVGEGQMVFALERPAREQKVAVAAHSPAHI